MNRFLATPGAALATALAIVGCGVSSSATTASVTTSTPAPSAAPSTAAPSPATPSSAATAATATAAPARPKAKPRPRPSVCPSGALVLAGVYHPARLRVIDPCRHVTGTVILTRSEEDGDLHFDVRLDVGTGMLMANNFSEQHGALVVELMPRDHGHLPAVAVGDRVSITGAYVDDTEHDWAEIHPVWALSINAGPTYRSGPQYGGSPAYARSDTAVSACTTNTHAGCVAYGRASAPAPTNSGSGSSSGSGGSSSGAGSPATGPPPVVHPGAYCAPLGGRGVTTRGTPMTCKTTATDPRARWRRSN